MGGCRAGVGVMSACSSSVNVFDNTSLHGVQNPLSKLCFVPGAGCAQQKEPKMRPKKKISVLWGRQKLLGQEVCGPHCCS